jgi:DNA-binding NarL/FixJ family response regulator
VVEDHPMMCAAMERALERAGIEVTGAAGSAAEAYELVGTAKPDVVVVDLQLPDETGVDLIRRLLERSANVAVVVYTGLRGSVILKDALSSGARAFAHKTSGPDSLVAAVRAAAIGSTYVSPELVQAIAANELTHHPRTLTDRERQMLARVADGLSNEQIGDRLMLSPETVRTHIRNAMRKLDTHTRAHAVVEALRHEEIGL